MKKYMLLFSIIALSCTLEGQETQPVTRSSSAISFYVGTLFYATPISVTYDHLWQREKVHLGISTGMVSTFLDGFQYNALGFYLAGVILTGKDSHHFEGRVGASYHPIYLYPEAGAKNEDLPFIPVITVGYRFQKPGDDLYYRLSFGTGGIGMGIGILLGHQD